MSDIPCGTPWPTDDDIQSCDDLPPEVVLNVLHSPEIAPRPEPTLGEVLDAIRDVTEELAELRKELTGLLVRTQTVTGWGIYDRSEP